jgi:hypothetical protein
MAKILAMDTSNTDTLTDRRRLLFEQLVRCETHWTQQLQNQQTRIATTLSVNGIMLAFIAGGGLMSYAQLHTFPRRLLFAAMICLAVGIGCGAMGLRPAMRTGGSPDERYKHKKVAFYLSSEWLNSEAASGGSEAALLDSLSRSINTDKVKGLIDERRWWIRLELIAIALGTVALVVLAGAVTY